MLNITRKRYLILIGLSVLAFVLAVVVEFTTGNIMGVGPEGFSRASNNLALIAIAVAVCSDRII